MKNVSIILITGDTVEGQMSEGAINAIQGQMNTGDIDTGVHGVQTALTFTMIPTGNIVALTYDL